MTKPFKLRLRLPSFQFCRSKKSSTLAKSPSPVTRTFTTPLNHKTFNITYPKSSSPPPSTPNYPSNKRNISSKILPIGSESVEPHTIYSSSSSSNMESPAYRHKCIFEKLYNTPDISDEFDQSVSTNKEATSFTITISRADRDWFCSQDGDDSNGESEGLPSSCSSLDFSADSAPCGIGSKRKKKNGILRRRKKCYGSNDLKDGEKIKLATSAMLPGCDFSVKKTVSGRLIPCMVDGKVTESCAIMKKSADPLDDFKMSMLEMILEKQLSEAEDLENLLMCFLSLNSTEHHEVIVAAFTEVWKELFSADSNF